MKIIHLSDLHFSSDTPNIWPHEIIKPLIDLVKKENTANVFLIISGDITTKGDKAGFDIALSFFNDLIKGTDINSKNIILCPGNHDISSEQSFSHFNSFSYSLRREDKSFYFDTKTTSAIVSICGNCFLSINSSQHLDKNYGLINIEDMKKLLDDSKELLRSSNSKIAVVHHHLLGIGKDDTSSIRNAYLMLSLLKDFGFNYIFHGHQHMRQVYSIDNIKTKGMSSLMDARSMSNCMGIYNIGSVGTENFIDYQYVKDEISGGKLGKFIEMPR